MTLGDFETFYPFQAGIGKNAPNNFESNFKGYSAESSATGDPDDDSGDDQNNTDYEGEAGEVGGIEEKQLPCFRELVRAKKKELKNQYGKGFFRTTDGHKEVCTNVPFSKWDPNINCNNIFGKRVCLGGLVGGTNRVCQTVDYPEIAWIPGWRREWRRFKKAGGLNPLKEQSVRCIFGAALSNDPIKEPSAPPVVPPTIYDIVYDSVNRKGTSGSAPAITKITNDNKINTYLVIGIVVAVLIIGGIYIFKTLKK